MEKRKYYIDNIRWITVLIVIIYHIIYIFNCSGVISNIDVQGIPILDTFLIFVYPWFMTLLFVVAGMSSRYSLNKRTNKEFLKERSKRVLLPSFAGIFIYGWINGVITNHFTDVFGGNGDLIPGFIKYLIYCLMGIGPLWFCHVLFVGSILLVVLRKIDKNDRLTKLGEKFKIWMIVPMFFVVWGSSKILNVPLISVYRMGIYVLHYIVVLLLGYWTVTYLHLPFIVNYLIILIGTIIILPLLIEIVKRIPILNKLVLGIK